MENGKRRILRRRGTIARVRARALVVERRERKPIQFGRNRLARDGHLRALLSELLLFEVRDERGRHAKAFPQGLHLVNQGLDEKSVHGVVISIITFTSTHDFASVQPHKARD